MPHPQPWPDDPRLDPELLAEGDRRNVVDRYRYWRSTAIVADLDTRRHPLHVAIQNWEHDFNIGSIVRTANAFNVAGVHIIGRRRWNRRGAMVTDRYLHVQHHADVADFAAGSAAAAYAGRGGQPARRGAAGAAELPERCCLVFGSEGPGLTAEMVAACQRLVAITQHGSTRSLNAGAAAAIAMYHWALRWGGTPALSGPRAGPIVLVLDWSDVRRRNPGGRRRPRPVRRAEMPATDRADRGRSGRPSAPRSAASSQELIDAELGPGDAIPSERALVTRLGVSRVTVRQAIADLVERGVLERVHGKGTYVTGPQVDSRLHLTSFSREMRDRGLNPATVVLSATEEPADDEVAYALRIRPGTAVVRVERLRTADGTPMAYEVGRYPSCCSPACCSASSARSTTSSPASTAWS